MEKIDKKDIFAVILAGGRGERLWPKSRISFPKQNLRLFAKGTIIQDTIERARKIVRGNTKNIFVIATKENSFNTIRQLKKFRIKKIFIEPFRRNTAPAIGLATLLAFKENKNSTLVIMPSDHLIVDNKKFFNAINLAINEANKEEVVVTLGIKPASAESAYGYIGIDNRLSRTSLKNSYKVIRFIEKPSSLRAGRLILSGRFFWNSGIFVFKASTVLSMLKRHTPTLHKGLLRLSNIKDNYRFNKKLQRLYERLESESFDHAILEKSGDIRVIPSDFGWSDIGSFTSIARFVDKDDYGNAIFGNLVSIDTKGSIIFSDTEHLVGTIGIKDLIVIVTSDAILVCDKKRAEDIKKLVIKIKKKKSLLKFL